MPSSLPYRVPYWRLPGTPGAYHTLVTDTSGLTSQPPLPLPPPPGPEQAWIAQIHVPCHSLWFSLLHFDDKFYFVCPLKKLYHRLIAGTPPITNRGLLSVLRLQRFTKYLPCKESIAFKDFWPGIIGGSSTAMSHVVMIPRSPFEHYSNERWFKILSLTLHRISVRTSKLQSKRR